MASADLIIRGAQVRVLAGPLPEPACPIADDPQSGLLGPLEVIEIERTGLIKDLTYRVIVIDLGLSDLRTWTDEGRRPSL